MLQSISKYVCAQTVEPPHTASAIAAPHIANPLQTTDHTRWRGYVIDGPD